MNNDKPQDMAALQAQLDAISAQLETLVRQQDFYRDMVDEFSPIAKEVMGVGANRLLEAETRGYFVFGKHMAKILNTVVDAYDEQDLDQLGDNVVYMIDTLRSFTQPNVLAIANEATAALQDDTAKAPKSLLGMLKASRNDDVRRGMAVMLNVLKHVGRAAKSARPKRSARMRRLESKMAPSRPRKAQAASASPAAAPAPTPAKASSGVVIAIPGYEMTEEGFLLDPNAWDKDFAKAIAAAVGYTITDAHWALIDWLRADFAKTNASANVRKIGKNSPSSTKDLYGMFPNAPALEAARLAGLPKPVGCI